MQRSVLAIGRWMPIHLGHKQFLVNLAKEYDLLVVGIGSCYENGTPRNCIPAIEREKLLRAIFKKEGISNFLIVHVPDRPTFDEWFSDIVKLCKKYNITHFCTGNKEDILDIMHEKNLELNTELINPEDTSNFPFHATDIRNAILKGDWGRLDSMIPSEIKSTVLAQVAKEIQLANDGKGQEFIPGRQTVDVVFIVYDRDWKKHYLLIGKRDNTKTDFPGYYAIPGGGIGEFESPVDAAVRCFKAETGIEITLKDNSSEPTIITIDNLNGLKGELFFTGIYASPDTSINGTQGGGSQCFATVIENNTEEICTVLHSTHDMVELKFVDLDEIHNINFAYDQKRMVYHALNMLSIPYDKGEQLQPFDENDIPINSPVSRAEAHEKGIMHGASHTYIYKIENGVLYLLLQRRSYNKDSFPGCLDSSSAGHIEFGSDFVETAIKELHEELGLNIPAEALEELFVQKIYSENMFHGKKFIDKEINKIYGLPFNPNLTDIQLQEEEVCEVLWVSAETITEALKSGESEIVINEDETLKVIDILSKRI